jgi:hypothetical protein
MMRGEPGQVLAVLLNELLCCAEHDRWCSSALTAADAQRQAQRGAEDVYRHRLQIATG